jgi:hypothetical protein
VFYASWAIALIYMIGLGLAIPFGVFALAISSTKTRTIKRIALVFITVSPSIVVLGILAAGISQSHLVARATGLLCVPVGLIAGTLSWLLGHKFAVTTSNLTLAVGQTRLQPYFEWETQSTHVQSWHSQTDDGKPFVTDGLRKLPDGSMGKSRLDYAREARAASEAANPQPQEQLSKSDAAWKSMAQEACRFGTHSQQAQIQKVYDDSQALPWRTIYEKCSRLVNQFKKSGMTVSKAGWYNR